MDRNRLFLETLDDLRQKIEQGESEYHLLKASALLRQLLIDQPRLIDQVDKNKKTKIRFRVTIAKLPDPNPVFWSINDGLDPDTSLINITIKNENIDEFLAHRIIWMDPYFYTIRDIIRQLAHIEGGVHIGVPLDEKESKLTEWSKNISVGGHPPGIRVIFAIGRVVLKGLDPLKHDIQKKLNKFTS